MQHPLTAKEAEECGKNSRARFFISLDTRIVSPELILAVHRLPQPQNNIVKYCVLQIWLKKNEICSSALGRSDDPSRVLQ
jgi:hypothetical protein